MKKIYVLLFWYETHRFNHEIIPIKSLEKGKNSNFFITLSSSVHKSEADCIHVASHDYSYALYFDIRYKKNSGSRYQWNIKYDSYRKKVTARLFFHGKSHKYVAQDVY